jgi:hypothetical protein
MSSELLSGGPSLYDACCALVLSKDLDDPLSAIRAKLKLFALLLAVKRGENPRAWSVYVERHIVGVRFMLRDARGHEVDLQQVPADPKELE